MLTPADELHVHQTPEPIAAAGTDRNFYDRSYFGLFAPGGELMAAVAFGIYPHLNVADAHLTVVRDGVQHSLHASRILHADRTRLEVGPVSIEVVRPLWELHVRVAEAEGLAADLTFTGLHFPLEEPRFIHRVGTRAFMDYTRMSQAATVTGSITVDGEAIAVPPGSLGLRDRSWGVRNVGSGDPQPPAPAVDPQFFWVWAPTRLGDRTTFFHLNADAQGRPWSTRAAIAPDGAQGGQIAHGQGRVALDLQPGTRWASGARIELRPDLGDGDVVLELTAVAHLEMQGLGYFHPRWAHGLLHGELVVERERIDQADAKPEEVHRWHREVLCDVRATHADGRTESGLGVLEHLVLGPYAPLGLT